MSLLAGLKPTVVSKDLKSKIVMFYGAPKSGKTTIASQFPKALIAATEIGFNALNNVYAMPIKKWGGKTKKELEGTQMTFTEFLKELDSEETKAKFDTIVIDTADILYQLAEDYVKSANGVSKIKDIEWGQGYKEAEEIFDKALREIPLKGYGLVIISHSEDKMLKDADGNEYYQIQPTLPKKPQRIVNRMADIIGYSATIKNEDGEDETRLIMRGNERVIAGSRWKHTPNSIKFTYETLVNTIHDAVEKAAEEDGVKSVEQQVNHYEEEKYDFEEVMQELTKLGQSFYEMNKLEIFTEVMEDTFYEGVKVGELEKEHVEAMAGVVGELQQKLESLGEEQGGEDASEE